MGVENLDKIFNPRRIAVIGASDREDSIGAKLFKNLIGVGYHGVVYPVNPFKPTILGITAYPSIKKIPWQVDLAIIATPAHIVPQIMEECGESGVKGVIIVSAGFSEVGEEGEALERQIIEIKERYGMRIIGPNSLGIIRPRIRLNATFADSKAIPGHIAFISQSAALCASVLDWASEANIGFSAVVSTGSMIDVDFGDLIDYFGMDPQTRSIILYMECVRDARKFISAARGFARAKPIIVIKAGRFPESGEATITHIGALCGDDMVYDAAFRRAGIVRVEAVSDLFSCAEALAMQANPQGSNLTIITNAGGPAVMAADTLIAKGGKLAKLAEETVKALRTILPHYCHAANPIDILEEASAERFKKVMEICFRDANSDGFLVIYTPQGAADPISTAKAIVEAARKTPKPVLACFIGEGACRKARRFLQRKGIPAFSTPEQAASTFMYMYRYTQNLELLYQTPEEIPVEVSAAKSLKELLKKAFNEGRTILTQHEALSFLKVYGIPVLETVAAESPEEAVAKAERLGYPVVMKALSPQIIHKSKAGGVVLNVWSKMEVERFFRELKERVKQLKPEAEFQGVILQPMILKRGYELLLGARRDPQFGSVIIFGTGGVAAEIINDIAVGLPPLNQVLARRLIEQTKFYRLTMVEGELHPNLRRVEEVLVKFSQLVIDFPEIREVEINPLLADEEGVVAVDARILIDPEIIGREIRPHEHLVIAPYPRKYVANWTLKNGESVILRPVKPEDEPFLREFYYSLSEETLMFRFFQVSREFSHETLTRHCNLDYDREMAIIAEKNGEKRMIIGVGMLTVNPGMRNGEFAVVVGDKWQGLGLGSKLMDSLIEVAEDMGLESIYGYIASNNHRMINLCKKKGFAIETVDAELKKAVLKIEKK
ncbi:bifunctional acetate--CoA ligase family protein/GNAT family N-acetyltransferase [Candidatus Bathyarchaeota archaeon]|nr:bifunctional acetate--CoA ligase family protein/GNAT family N-acetyltransferase [Candidatus Bathyarchaeota archaeon]